MKERTIWENLKISSRELEEIIRFNFFDGLALTMTNASILNKSKQKLELLFSEVTLAFLFLIFSVPIILVIGRKLLSFDNQLHLFLLILVLAIAISLLCLLIFNFYLWRKAKKLKKIAVINQKVEQYNQLINSLQLLSQIDDLSLTRDRNKKYLETQIDSALNTTKQSLIQSLKIEKLLLDNQKLQTQSYYQILNNLEDDLIGFISLSNSQEATEYQKILLDAMEIGLSVHQELRKSSISLAS